MMPKAFKNRHLRFMLGLWIFIFSISLISCNSTNKVLPAVYQGSWQADSSKVTVRTEPQWMKFEFTSDTVSFSLIISEDKTVSGIIGLTGFENGKIRKNGGNPDRTGVAYIIECGKIGKIFEGDPLSSKEVELWLSPIKEDQSMEAELRYTQGMAAFPMAWIHFRIVK